MSVSESLRSLLRALTIHEKEIFKVASDNLFMLNFIVSQFDENRADPIADFEAEEKLNALEAANLDNEEEGEIGASAVVDEGNDETAWTGNWDDAAWKDDEDTSPSMGAAGSQQVSSFIDQAASHFADIAEGDDTQGKKKKNSTKRARGKK
jgi:hypothetical protein